MQPPHIEYITINKCKYFINLNDKNEILKHESLHYHLEKEFNKSISITKHIIIKLKKK